jgi:hypothetical protein
MGCAARDFLHAGALGMLGLGLTDLFRLRASGAVDPVKDKNCIFLMLVGGPSQLDLWDMKPNAPAEIRGPYRPIKTNVPGIEISEIFPRMARAGRQVCADSFLLPHRGRGPRHRPPDDADGKAVPGWDRASERRQCPRRRCADRGVTRRRTCCCRKPIGATGGNMPHGHGAGFLGKQYDPFILNADPSQPNFKVPDMLPPEYISTIRTDRRRRLREMVDQSVRELEAGFKVSQDARLLDDNFNQAYTLMSSAKMREAFDLTQEDEATQDRYGRNRFGMSCLMARRMIERGVRYVTINMFETVFNEITWDIHGSAPFSPIACYRDLVGPMFDQGYSSLLEDLGAARAARRHAGGCDG